jgi:hypothetical protein
MNDLYTALRFWAIKAMAPTILSCSRTSFTHNASNQLQRQSQPHIHNTTSSPPPQGNITIMVGPTYTRGSTPTEEWGLSTCQQHVNVDAYISEAQQMRRNIAAERAAAQAEDAKWHMPGVYNNLSRLLASADILAQERIASAQYRQGWEGRWGTAQFWSGGHLGLVHDNVRSLIGRLWDCQFEAAQLRELVAKTRRELRL